MAVHKFLVIGQGSIGQRHARLLSDRGAVSSVSAEAPGAYRSITAALEAEQFTHAVVANVTSRHGEAVDELARSGFTGSVLIEKPLCNDLTDLEAIRTSLENISSAVVGYNLRFHPVVRAMAAAISGKHVFEARLSVGQRLSDWRPGTDYKSSSSARIASGGGVLRDLSHELDMALHLFGPWKRLVSLGGNFGLLGIETDEAWSVIMEMRNGAMLTISLNYFDRPAHRSITATTADETLRADLIANCLNRDGSSESFSVERDDTYRALHDDFVGNGGRACTIDEAREVMSLIDAIERSASERKWIEA